MMFRLKVGVKRKRVGLVERKGVKFKKDQSFDYQEEILVERVIQVVLEVLEDRVVFVILDRSEFFQSLDGEFDLEIIFKEIERLNDEYVFSEVIDIFIWLIFILVMVFQKLKQKIWEDQFIDFVVLFFNNLVFGLDSSNYIFKFEKNDNILVVLKKVKQFINFIF